MTEKLTLAEAATAWAKGEIVLQRARGSQPWHKVPALGLNLPVLWDSRVEYKLKERDPYKQVVYAPVNLDSDGHVVVGDFGTERDEVMPGSAFILSLELQGRGENLYISSYGAKLTKVEKPDVGLSFGGFDKAAEVPS